MHADYATRPRLREGSSGEDFRPTPSVSRRCAPRHVAAVGWPSSGSQAPAGRYLSNVAPREDTTARTGNAVSARVREEHTAAGDRGNAAGVFLVDDAAKQLAGRTCPRRSQSLGDLFPQRRGIELGGPRPRGPWDGRSGDVRKRASTPSTATAIEPTSLGSQGARTLLWHRQGKMDASQRRQLRSGQRSSRSRPGAGVGAERRPPVRWIDCSAGGKAWDASSPASARA